MATRTVEDPAGRTWTVRRRWTHRRVSWRGPKGDGALDLLNGADLAGDASDLPVLGVIVFAVLALITVALAVVFVIPGLIFVLELLLVAVALVLGALGRIVFRRPWTVEARLQETSQVTDWRVTGWRASGALVDSVAERVQSTSDTQPGVKQAALRGDE